MPYNVPTTTTDDISFGPAVIFSGPAGTTPTVDVGSITEDGATLELNSEKRTIAQGNPRVPVLAFSQAQGVMLNVTGIEWNYENFAAGLGAGVTGASGSEETFEWGGDPLCQELAIHVQHYMAVSGNTMNAYIWKAVSEGGLSLPMGQDEHQFEYNFQALLASTDWAGNALGPKVQLFKLVREL